MNIYAVQQSTPGQSPASHPTPDLSPATIALLFTITLMQAQVSYQGNARDLLLTFIAALLAASGVIPNHPRN